MPDRLCLSKDGYLYVTAVSYIARPGITWIKIYGIVHFNISLETEPDRSSIGKTCSFGSIRGCGDGAADNLRTVGRFANAYVLCPGRTRFMVRPCFCCIVPNGFYLWFLGGHMALCLVEGIWSIVALRRWWLRFKLESKTKA